VTIQPGSFEDLEKEFAGGAVIAHLTSDIGGTDIDRVIPVDTVQGWPTGLTGVFEASIGRGTPTEEKILCASSQGTPGQPGTLTIYVDPNTQAVGRGYDDTAVRAHSAGATVEHVWTATDARESMKAAKALKQNPAHSHGTWRSIRTGGG
jgi:hypothetical protein